MKEGGAQLGAMRVGMFSECYEPVRNGVTTSVHTLVDQLRSLGHRVILVAPHYESHRDQSPFILRVPSIQTWLNKDYPISYPFFPRLRREFGQLQPDIVHSHNPFFVGLLAARLAHMNDVPLVSTYHTLYNHYGHYVFFLPLAAIQGLLKWWIPDYYNRCAQVIVPSEVARISLLEYGVQSPITIIPTAVPLPDPTEINQEARIAARAQWEIPADVPLLLYVGRIAQEKNIEMILDAFAVAGVRHPDARLLVVGGGPHCEAIHQHGEQLSVSSRIIFAGPMARSELNPVYAAADIFVFGSTTETQGLVMAEARAAGTPSIVARGGGAGETVTDGEDGILIEPTAEAMAAAMDALLDDRRRLGEMRAACLRNAHHYTPEAMVTKVLDVYRAALDVGNMQDRVASAA